MLRTFHGGQRNIWLSTFQKTLSTHVLTQHRVGRARFAGVAFQVVWDGQEGGQHDGHQRDAHHVKVLVDEVSQNGVHGNFLTGSE